MPICYDCNKKILSKHNYLKCSTCLKYFNLECLQYLNLNEYRQIIHSKTAWSCTFCLENIFPFYNIEDNNIFLDLVTNNIYPDDKHKQFSNLDNTTFVPFELEESVHSDYLKDIDPDKHFYNSVSINSEYYTTQMFNSKVESCNLTDNSFSLLHLNIRSAPKNLSSLHNYLIDVKNQFSIIGLTETWFNETTADLYGIHGYSGVHTYRSCKRGGGVSLFVNNNIPFEKRNDLSFCEKYCECLFIEIQKDVLNTSTPIAIGVF